MLIHMPYFIMDVTDVPSKYYEKEEKTITGTITHLYESYGLVDGYIYFNKKNIRTDDRPEVYKHPLPTSVIVSCFSC